MAFKTFSKYLFVTGSLVAAATSQAAFAQIEAAEEQRQQAEASGADATEETIIVTGSRIPRRNLDTGQPTLVLDNQLIEQRGYNTIADALQDLPSFGVPGSSRAGQQAGAFGSGQNFVNFFGIGDQRTLVVVNGRRFVSSNTASIFGPTGAGIQVDLNVIPTLLVDRVETIAIGGAPIYGSDAIAGTVNVITKRDFDGLQLDTQYGISERGDARDFRVRGLVGTNFADGRGNITVAGEYNDQRGLTFDARPGRRLNSFFTTPLDDSPFDRSISAIAASRRSASSACRWSPISFRSRRAKPPISAFSRASPTPLADRSVSTRRAIWCRSTSVSVPAT